MLKWLWSRYTFSIYIIKKIDRFSHIVWTHMTFNQCFNHLIYFQIHTFYHNLWKKKKLDNVVKKPNMGEVETFRTRLPSLEVCIWTKLEITTLWKFFLIEIWPPIPKKKPAGAADFNTTSRRGVKCCFIKTTGQRSFMKWPSFVRTGSPGETCLPRPY